MANSFGMIDEALWRRDKEFRQLPRFAQCTFVQLLSQRDLDCAGVLTLHVELLAKSCDGITAEDIRSDLKVLEEAGFVFVDEDTDELLIRSYVRRPAGNSPNILKAAYKAARAVCSPKLRAVLARELRRMNKADAARCADEIDANWTLPDTVSEGIEKVSATLPKPFQNPSERGNPSETLSEPPSTDTDTSVASPSVVGHLGGTRARAQAREVTDPNPQQEPPSRNCSKHPGGTPDNCRACADARRAHDAAIAAREAAEAERAHTERAERVRAAQAAAAAILDCPLCDDTGYRFPQCVTVCDHEDHTETARNGLEKVRAALKVVRDA